MKLRFLAMLFLASASAAIGVLARAAPAQTPQIVAKPITIGETQSIQSKALGEAREINIYLPPAYADKTKRFPVLYLIDGGLDQDFLHVAGTGHLGAIWGRSQPVIIVGIATKDRRKELIGPTRDAEALKRAPTAGKSANFRAFIRDEVKPMIARSYRTSGIDAVIGESLAGLFIVETYLREPSLFGSYAAISPSLWWDKERLSYQAAELLGQKSEGRPLYLSIANEGGAMQSGMDRLVAALSARTRWCYAPRPDLTHATIYHGISSTVLQFLFSTDVKHDPESGFEIKCSKKS